MTTMSAMNGHITNQKVFVFVKLYSDGNNKHRIKNINADANLRIFEAEAEANIFIILEHI
jgi:hypothetical protein